MHKLRPSTALPQTQRTLHLCMTACSACSAVPEVPATAWPQRPVMLPIIFSFYQITIFVRLSAAYSCSSTTCGRRRGVASTPIHGQKLPILYSTGTREGNSGEVEVSAMEGSKYQVPSIKYLGGYESWSLLSTTRPTYYAYVDFRSC